MRLPLEKNLACLMFIWFGGDGHALEDNGGSVLQLFLADVPEYSANACGCDCGKQGNDT